MALTLQPVLSGWGSFDGFMDLCWTAILWGINEKIRIFFYIEIVSKCNFYHTVWIERSELTLAIWLLTMRTTNFVWSSDWTAEFQQLVKLAIRETSFCFGDFDSPIPYAARCPPYAPQCAEMYCCDNNLGLVGGKLIWSFWLWQHSLLFYCCVSMTSQL